MTAVRRAVVLCRPGTPSREVERLANRYMLKVVHTIFTDTESSKLAALVALQHVVEHDTEVVVVPYLTYAQVTNDQHWQSVTATSEVITVDGPSRNCRG